MALRSIRKEGDEILRKRAKEVNVINDRILDLLNDMVETMYENNGVGLAAPQVGVLKRVIVVDTENGKGLYKLINPGIVHEEGEQCGTEGCLSVPGVFGEVKRPKKVIVEALNEKGEKVRVTGEGLLAVALCHEIDHLDGILFRDKVVRYVDSAEKEKRK
ncbi:MAG: peptide deformylase [Clostridiaceae bacterium]|nr:peptide deformylase [Clostridiaceae bacterium]